MPKLCDSDHRYLELFEVLPDHQGDIGRHKCAGCAYELGMRHARMGIASATSNRVLRALPRSQAGTVRHKDAYAAYLMGYDDGCAEKAENEVA